MPGIYLLFLHVCRLTAVELQTPLSLGCSTDRSDSHNVEVQEVPIPFTSFPTIQGLEPESQDGKSLWVSLLVGNDDS